MISLLIASILVFAQPTKDNTVILNSMIDQQAYTKLVQDLNDKHDPNKELYLLINSQGGRLDLTDLLINHIKNNKMRVHTITILSAGAAFHLVQALGTRYVLEDYGVFAIIKAQSGISPKEVPPQFKDAYNLLIGVVGHLESTSIKRMGWTRSRYDAAARNEQWISSTEALLPANNLADKKLKRNKFIDKLIKDLSKGS